MSRGWAKGRIVYIKVDHVSNYGDLLPCAGVVRTDKGVSPPSLNAFVYLEVPPPGYYELRGTSACG